MVNQMPGLCAGCHVPYWTPKRKIGALGGAAILHTCAFLADFLNVDFALMSRIQLDRVQARHERQSR